MNRCYKCTFLDAEKKVDGKVSGALHYCKKMDKFVNPLNDACPNYEKCWFRKATVIDELYENGKKYDNSPAEPGKAIFYLVIMLILALIAIIFG